MWHALRQEHANPEHYHDECDHQKMNNEWKSGLKNGELDGFAANTTVLASGEVYQQKYYIHQRFHQLMEWYEENEEL